MLALLLPTKGVAEPWARPLINHVLRWEDRRRLKLSIRSIVVPDALHYTSKWLERRALFSSCWLDWEVFATIVIFVHCVYAFQHFGLFSKQDLPPKCLDDQPAPKSFLRWVRIMQGAEKKTKKCERVRRKSEQCAAAQQVEKRKRKEVHHSPSDCESKQCDKSIFKRRKGESTRQFLERVNFEADQQLLASQKKALKSSTKRKE